MKPQSPKSFGRIGLLVLAGAVAASYGVPPQPRRGVDPELAAKRQATEAALQAAAVVERKLMVPMRDGKRMAADVCRPKDAPGKCPAIFVRTPYNFNFWDVRNRVPRDMTAELEAVKRGYAYVQMNERGRTRPESSRPGR